MSVPRVRWDCQPYAFGAAHRLARELGVDPVVASILVRRGYGDAHAARRFLAADARHDPLALPGMPGARDRILEHLRRGSRIVVHGDFDVDGVCATAVLVRCLRRLGADARWHIPSRADEGYGLSAVTVERLAARGAGLLVTVDCGIASAREVALATRLGLDVVVTDHHRPGDELPDCPVVHPALGAYPCPELCATGVAHKLSEALLAGAGDDPALAREDLDLVALATVCDVVPLVDENRRLVREGLRALARTSKPGLRALMRVAAVDPGSLDARALGFRLGPRLNAAGRLARADAALELLMTEDEQRAAEVADELDLLNRERQDVESRILFAAEALRAEQDAQAAFVLAGEGWHAGVIGIVASRMVERHHRPCVMIALGEDGARGSGRSIPAYDLHAGLAACAEHLRRFGGHRAAAGLELDPDRLDAFRQAFAAHAAAMLSPQDLAPVQRIDAIAPPGSLGLGLAEQLERLEPFGHGNPEPTLLVPAARVGDVSGMGDERQHARFTLLAAGARARAVAFRTPPGALRELSGEPHDVAVRLEANEWNGAIEPRLVLSAACPTATGGCVPIDPEPDFWEAVLAELDAGAETSRGADAGAEASRGAKAGMPARRTVVDARGRGVAAIVADLVSTGACPLLLACADVPRRRAGVERVLGGLPATLGRAGAGVRLVSWHALAADPALATPFAHVVAIDPPPHPDGETLVAATGDGFAHLAWGPAEAAFALQVAEAELALRPALAEAFRALRDAGGAEGKELASLLRGSGRHPRRPAVCGRMLRVLLELELVELDRDVPACTVLDAPRTDLHRSPSYRAYTALLDVARRYLAAACDPGELRRAA